MRTACVWPGEGAYEFWRDMAVMYLWRGAALSMARRDRWDWSQCLGLDSKVILTLLGNKQDPREDVSRSLVRKWVDDENVSLTLQNRWISFWMRIWPEPRGCVWATLNCDSVQTWDKGASELIRRGRRLFLVREVCHRVKFVRGTLTK
jgi:hypothetical protein